MEASLKKDARIETGANPVSALDAREAIGVAGDCDMRISLLALLFLWLLAVPSAAQWESKVPYTRAKPVLNEETQAGAGDVLFEEVAGLEVQGVRVLGYQQILANGATLSPGMFLYSSSVNGRQVYCDKRLTIDNTFSYLCLEDADRNGRFDAIVAKRYKTPKSVKVDLAYELAAVDVASGAAGEFRRELVYGGAGGGVLRLAYREFVGALARPAFSQEATFDLTSGETEVTFKGVKLRVLEVNNSTVRYVVLSGFNRGN